MIEIRDFVMQLVANKSGRLVDTNWWNIPLDELGRTSIDLAEIHFDIEERFNVEIRLDHLPHHINGMRPL